MAKGLYYYKLVGYPEDITKNCKLTINEIDSNFFELKSNDIESAEFIRDDKILVLTRRNGEKLIVDLSDITYDLRAGVECSDSGVTFTMHYDSKDGVNDIKMEHLITLEMLRSKIEELIGTDILTKVITDNTLKGYGTLDSPLGLNGAERTGMYAPVIAKIDMTTGGTLPEVAKLGTRYATVEYVNDYGYLYNLAGVNKIADKIASEGRGWRVPTKADWDKMLNLIEPCEYRNHSDAACHKELGMYAGKYLKSACGWIGQPDCACSQTVPITSCSYDNGSNYDYVSGDTDMGIPSVSMDGPQGVDKYGMTVLPTGVGVLDAYGRPQSSGYGAKAVLWTSSHIKCGDTEMLDQDIYVKVFDHNRSGVVQEAECPSPYYGVRLVKDYDGSNYFDTEYIDGIPYKTILFPEIRQIWLASNYAQKEGFVTYTLGGETPEVVEVNNGEIKEKRKAVFVNEWNGCYWERKELEEGATLVVEYNCFDTHGGEEVTEVCWNDSDGVQHCVEVVIPEIEQYNLEYRVYTTGETGTDAECDQDLVNTDYLATERLLKIVIPMLDQERHERIEADEALSGAIETEREERISADTEIWESLIEEIEERIAADIVLSGAIDTEREERIEADEALSGAIDTEREDRIAADEALSGAIDTEREERIAADEALSGAIDTEREERIAADIVLSGAIDTEREERIAADELLDGQLIDVSKNPYVLSACTLDENNLVLESKDGNPEHFIKIDFDANFGEI